MFAFLHRMFGTLVVESGPAGCGPGVEPDHAVGFTAPRAKVLPTSFRGVQRLTQNIKDAIKNI